MTSANEADIFSHDFEVKVFPNPVESVLELKLENELNYDYVIYDQYGKVLDFGKVNSTRQIGFINFPSGMYHLILYNKDSKGHTRIIKI